MKTSLKPRSRTAASATSIAIIVLLIALIAVAAYVAFPKQTQSAVNQFTCNGVVQAGSCAQTSTSSNVNPNNVAGKIQFNIADELASGGLAATVNVYPYKGTVIGGETYSGFTESDTGTASAQGVYTTSNQYPPGAMLNVEVVLSGYSSEWFTVQSPGVTAAAQAQGTAAEVNLAITKLGTFSITVVDDRGNSYTSGTTKANFTNSGHCTTNNFCLGETTINFQVTIRNSAPNTGYSTSTDPLTGNQWGDALVLSTAGSSVSVSQSPSILRGTTTYWPISIPDGITGGVADGTGISMQTINSRNVGGSYVVNIAISQGTLTHGSTQSFTISQELYASIPYFTSNEGSWNPEATTTGAASPFTLILAA